MIYYLTTTGNGSSPDGTLPAGAVVCTQAQYDNASAWTVSGGAVVAAPPPGTSTLAQQAAALLAIGAPGLTIIVTGPTLTIAAPGVAFPVDPISTGKIGNVVLTAMKTDAFPLASGSSTPPTTFPMKDASGGWHYLTMAQYGAVATQLASYASALDLIADGNPQEATTLPQNSVTIEV